MFPPFNKDRRGIALGVILYCAGASAGVSGAAGCSITGTLPGLVATCSTACCMMTESLLLVPGKNATLMMLRKIIAPARNQLAFSMKFVVLGAPKI